MHLYKSASELLKSLITWVSTGTSKITDFSIGSAIRTLLEAVALQLEEFYFNLHQSVEYAIENAVYNAFGFSKNAASNSTGFVTLTFKNTIPQSITLKSGTVFSTNPGITPVIYFTSTEDIVIIAGTRQALIPVECTTKGTVGNLPANTINHIITTNSYIESVNNESSFINGNDEESNVSRKARFKEYIRSLQRGTKEAIAYGTKTVTGVAGAWVDDNYIGFVRVYAHDSNGELPNLLKNKILEVLEDYRAAGIEAEVLPVVKTEINVNLNLILKDSADMDGTVYGVENLVTNFLNNFQVSENLYASNLLTLITSSYKDVVVNIEVLEGQDTNIQNNEIIKAGIVTITGEYLSDWRG
jgi:uncharacterized phage protein gp47/JayE